MIKSKGGKVKLSVSYVTYFQHSRRRRKMANPKLNFCMNSMENIQSRRALLEGFTKLVIKSIQIIGKCSAKDISIKNEVINERLLLLVR